MSLRRTNTLLLALIPASIFADWTVGVEGGSVIRDGDTATRLRARASLDERPLSHYLYADWIRSGTSSYELGYKLRYWFSEKLYGFGDASLRVDKALLIDRQSLVLGGVGLQLVSTKTQQAWIESGLGYRVTRYDDTQLDDAKETLGVLRGGASQVLNDLFRIELDADVYKGETYLQTQAEVGLSTRIQQGSIKISHRVRRFDIDGVDAIDDSDTTVAFVVGF